MSDGIVNSDELSVYWFAQRKAMAKHADKLVSEIRSLPKEKKLRVLDALLADLHETDPEIDAVWANEARKRWEAYKAGRLATVSYEELMNQYDRK